MKSRFYLLASILLLIGTEIFCQQQTVDQLKTELSKARASNNQNNTIHYLSKLAHAYWQEKNYDNAISNFKELQELSKKAGNSGGVERIYNILGQIYYDKGDNENAIAAYSESLTIKRKAGSKEAIVSEMLNLASIYPLTGNKQKAISLYNEALGIAVELNNLVLMRSIYGGLAENYNSLGESEKAMEYYEQFVRLDRHLKQNEFKDFMSKSNARIQLVDSARRLTERELSLQTGVLTQTQDSLITANIENRQRQLEILTLNQERELQEIKIREKEAQVKYEKNVRNYVIFALVFILLFVFWLYKLYRDIRTANVLLEEKNIVIDRKSRELEQTNDELQKRNEKIEAQREELFRKNTQITESITYASKIQRAILPAEIAIRSAFPDSFVYFRPRDIVSGDFYWYTQHNDVIWMAAVDCTGHSVPGAFMSMMGYSLLNEIVNEKRIESPAEVLQLLDKGVIKSLHQRNKNSEASDGLEISLIKYDFSTKKLHIVNTNQTIVLFNKNGIEIIEGDFYSIGGDFTHFENKTFTERIVNVEPGDKIYLFSDGFEDQFGGPFNKKFLVRNFIELIKTNADLKMVEQEIRINDRFETWRSNYEQTDDVLVIGLRF